jgi:hypothetical protein
MAAAIELRRFLTLQDIAGSLAITSQEVTADVNRLLTAKWIALKTLPCMTSRMVSIENRTIGPIENKVHELFLELAKTCGVSSYFGDIIPVSIGAYTQLYQNWEDESLLALWRAVCHQFPPPRHKISSIARRLVSVKQARSWFADPANTPRLMKITHLYLLNCGLKVIPPEIGFLTRLQVFGASGNLIGSIPPAIGLCTQLRELCLADNQISSIPPEIASCTKLQEFYLDKNPILSPPPGTAAWLQEFNCPFIPAEILSYVELQTLLGPDRIDAFLVETDRDNSNVRCITKVKRTDAIEPCTLF